jgi:parallel beta-helix repeat protein
MVNSQINGDIKVLDGSGKKSFFSNNNIMATLEISNADIFDSSIGILKATDSQLIRSTVKAGITGNSLIIDGCKIYGSGGTPYGAVSAMNLEGKVTITNSVISGGGTSYDLFFRTKYEVPAIEIEHGLVIISNNTITGNIKVSLENGDQAIIFDNQIEGSIVASGSPIIVQNNTVQGISFGGSQIIVSDNLVVNGSGIDVVSEGSVVIERNLIRNNHQGIRCNSGGVTIRNNTLKDNRIALYVSTPDCIEFIYNNILNCSDSIVLTTASNFEAANNYWMPNDKVSIDNSIHDYYDDFNLGKVNYSPVLTEQNMQAMPDPNAKPPEVVLNEVDQNQVFPLQVALAAVVAAVVFAGAALAVIKDRKNKKRA